MEICKYQNNLLKESWGNFCHITVNNHLSKEAASKTQAHAAMFYNRKGENEISQTRI